MKAYLNLKAESGMIGSATDFTYKWCVNAGLEPEEAARMALAVDEILTDIALYAYGEEVGDAEIRYRYSLSEIEIVIRETGEPFDPDKHAYSPGEQNGTRGLKGAGREIVEKMTDHFLFLNRGRDGKEFRLVKRFTGYDIRNLTRQEEPSESVEDEFPAEDSYLLTPATSEDAEDIAKLIYQSYDYSYSKEDLYFPKRIELAIRNEYKFGTIVRTTGGVPAGFFAVTMNTDSHIGEIGEAVVSPHHRKQGLMKRMLGELLEMSRQRQLLGLYGMALTVHTISQKVNEKYGFRSTALLLAKSPPATYRGLGEQYPQPLSMILDFLPLAETGHATVFLPTRYESVIRKVYDQFVHHPDIKTLPDQIPRDETETKLDLTIYYESNSALIVVQNFGRSFESSCLSMSRSLVELKLSSIYIDLPLDHAWIEPAVEWLRDYGFILAGLMPLFHKDRDYVRMQKINIEIDFNLLETHTVIATELKERIAEEYHALQET